MEEKFDSTESTMWHKNNVERIMNVIITELQNRAQHHDESKLESPEKETYDKCIPLLKERKYGTVEYLKVREAMAKEGLSHHYEVNRHHPEHFPNADISYMTLVDLVEMFVDHYASSLNSDADYFKGEKMNAERYHYSDQIYQILINTAKEYFE